MKIKGNDIIAFFQVGKEWKTLAYGVSCELDVTAETIAVSNPSSGKWPKKKKKRMSWAGSSSHLLSDEIGAVDLKRLVQVDTPIKILIGSVEVHKDAIDYLDYLPDGRYYFAGDAFVTRVTISANRGTSCSMSLEFEGSGEPDWRDFNEVIMQGNELLLEHGEKVYNVINE